MIKTIVSHHSNQGLAYRTALAGSAQGFDAQLLTSFYFKPTNPFHFLAGAATAIVNPGWHEKLWRRRLEELPESQVIQLRAGSLSLMQRLLRRGPDINQRHDQWAAAWLQQRGRAAGDLFHGFSGLALESLQTAKSLGMVCLLEITSPPQRDKFLAKAFMAHGQDLTESAREDGVIMEEISLADAVIVQARFVAEHLKSLGVPEDKIILRPLAADPVFFEAADAPPPPQSGKPRFVCVGHLTLAKGLDWLLSAWRACSTVPGTLTLIGPVHDDFGQALVSTLPAGVTWLGATSRTEIAHHLRTCDFLISPSLCEGGPLVVLEALASGLPVIAAHTACGPVHDRGAGLVIPCGDVQALTGILESIAAGRLNAETFRPAARAQGSNFTWDLHAQRTRAIYAGVVTRAHPRQGLWDLTQTSDHA